MYRMLAIGWLVAGVALIIYDNYTGDSAWVIRGLGISPGWLMLLLSAYNFTRWWAQRLKRVTEDAEHRAWAARQPPVRRLPQRQEPPDPNFNFKDEPRTDEPRTE